MKKIRLIVVVLISLTFIMSVMGDISWPVGRFGNNNYDRGGEMHIEEKCRKLRKKHRNEMDNKAKAAVCDILANVRSRYRAKLDYYGLTEALFDETNGICDLRLRNVASWTTYQIVYYRGTDEIQWPLTMPKGLAKDFMRDRLIIHTYEKSISNESE